MKKILLILTLGLMFGQPEISTKLFYEGSNIDSLEIDILENDNKNNLSIFLDKTTLGVGFVSSKGLNYLEISKDIEINSKWSANIGFGFPRYGVSLIRQSNYNDTGFYFGLKFYNDINSKDSYITMAFAYQWVFNSNNFISLGFNWGNEYTYNEEERYWGSGSSFIPIISYDYRF